MAGADASLAALKAVHDAIFMHDKPPPLAGGGAAQAQELASQSLKGAAELHRQLGDLSTTQDLLANATDAVVAMHGAACGNDEGHALAGVGITVVSDMGGFRIKKLLSNSPAEWVSGSLLAGDRLLAINGHALADKTLGQVTTLLTGPPNSKVTIEGQRDTRRLPYTVTLRRAGKEGSSKPARELCAEALDAIKQMREQVSEVEEKDANMRKLQKAASLHESNAASLQQQLNKMQQELVSANQTMKDQDAYLQVQQENGRKWQARAQDHEQRVHLLTAEKEGLASALDKATLELQERSREIEQQRSSLASKADVEKKLQNSILDAHILRGTHAKLLGQVSDGESEITRLMEELQNAKKLESEVADLKSRLAVAHRRLTESEESVMRLRPYEKEADQLEKRLAAKATQLSKTEELLQECEENLVAAIQREKDVTLQLQKFREDTISAEAKRAMQIAEGAQRISQLEKAIEARDGQVNELEQQLQKSRHECEAAKKDIEEGLGRENIADEKCSAMQRTVAEQVATIDELRAAIDKAKATIEQKLPALQKEVQTLNATASAKQCYFQESIEAMEQSVNAVGLEAEQQKGVNVLLQQAQEHEAKLLQSLECSASEIRLLKGSIKSKDDEIAALGEELGAKCKGLATATTQIDLLNVKCNGMQVEAAEASKNIASLKLERDKLRAELLQLQLGLGEAKAENVQASKKVHLSMQENLKLREQIDAQELKLCKLRELIDAQELKVGKSEHQRQALEAHNHEQSKQIKDLKDAVGRLEVRIRVQETDKAGISKEKGGLAEQLAKLDADFRSLQEQLAEAHQALASSEQLASSLQAQTEALQAKHEIVVQEAADNATAGRVLIDACRGFVAERSGVGMVLTGSIVSRHAQSRDFFVKELIVGGSAGARGQIELGDVLVTVDGVHVQGMSMAQVQDLILGPEGTTVALALLRPSPTGGVRYSQMLVRGQATQHGLFAKDAREAIDAVSNVHEESRAHRARAEELAKLLAAAKANILELDKITSAQTRSMETLNEELRQTQFKLETAGRDLMETQSLLAHVEGEHSTCGSKRNSLERIINDLHGKIEFYQAKLEALGSEKVGNTQKLAQIEAELKVTQQRLQKSQEIEKYLKEEVEARRREMKDAMDSLQASYEQAAREASENEAAGRGLLDSIAGHVSEKAGVGMVVRTVAEGPGNLSARTAKSSDFSVKQLMPGGSAAESGQIEVNDIVTAVNNFKIAGLTIEEVQSLILGPENTTVTIGGLKLSPTGGTRYSVKLRRGDFKRAAKPFATEAKEAIDALNALQYEANKALSARDTLEKRVAALEAEISRRDCTAEQMQAEMDALQTKLASSERNRSSSQAMLDEERQKHCNCEKERREMNQTIDRFHCELTAMQSRIAEADGLKRAFDASFQQEQELKKRLADVQSELEEASKKASKFQSSGFQLLDAMSGRKEAQTKGIGMVVRIETSKPDGEYQVKQLIPGGSASKSMIRVGDTILAVDSIPIVTLPIEKVQELILGPEGTTVTITGVSDGKRFSETLMRGEPQHTSNFEEESEAAILALDAVHAEAREAKAVRKGLEDSLAASEEKMVKLSALVMKLQTALDEEKGRGVRAAEQVVTLSLEVRDLQNSAASTEEQNKQLQEKFASINRALNTAESARQQERSSSVKVSKDLDETRHECLRLRIKLEESLKSSSAEIHDLKRQLDDREEQVSKAANKIHGLEKEHNRLASRLEEALEAIFSATEAVHGQTTSQCGVGMIVRVEERGKYCTVTSLTPGGSAMASGVLECGDTIRSIEGKEVRGMSLLMVQERIIGPAGTRVELSGTHINAEPFSVELVRGIISDRESQSIKELGETSVVTAKGLHKEISRLSRSLKDAQEEVRSLKMEVIFAEKREHALHLAMRGVEQDHVSTSGSLHSRMAELELVKNDLNERERRLAVALEQVKTTKAELEENRSAQARLGGQVSDLTKELAVERNAVQDRERQLEASKAETQQVLDERGAALESLQKAQHEVECLKAVVTDLQGQVDHGQRKLSLAATARESLETLRALQYEEMKLLKSASASFAQGLSEAEKNFADLKQETEKREFEYSVEATGLKASLGKEQALTAAMEKQLEMSKIEIAAARKLLELMQGFAGQRRGVGMLVRTHSEKNCCFSVKELYEGGSAALSARIQIGDVIEQIDGSDVEGLTIDQVQNLIVGPEGSAVTIRCRTGADEGNAGVQDSETHRSSGFLPLVSPRELQNMLTFRAKPSPPKGRVYSVTLLRGDWAQSDKLIHQIEGASDRVRALQAESVEARKMIQILLQVLRAQQHALLDARSMIEQSCMAVKLQIQEHEGEDSPCSINIDASLFTSVDESAKAELDAHRAKAAHVLSDIVEYTKMGLDAFDARGNLISDQEQLLRTAEARNEQQSESIADLKENCAVLETKLKAARHDIRDCSNALEKANTDLEQLRTAKKENLSTIVDLKNELAEVLKAKQAIDADRGGLTKRTRALEHQLSQAEGLVEERAEKLVKMESKISETETLYSAHLEQLTNDNMTLSKDLVELQTTSGTLRSRCGQQTEVIAQLKETLASSEANLKVLTEENGELYTKLKNAEQDSTMTRARLAAAIEEHAEQSAKAQARMEASLQEQERLRREAAQIKREKIAKDLYVTDVEGKLSSRESSLSDSQKELNVLKNSVREMEEENRKITARFQEADQELKQTRLARGALASRIEALSLSHTDEEARINAKWKAALEELEYTKRLLATAVHERDEACKDLANAAAASEKMYSAMTARKLSSETTRSRMKLSLLERATECEVICRETFTRLDEKQDLVQAFEAELEEERTKISAANRDLNSARETLVDKIDELNKALAAVKVLEVEREALVKMSNDQGVQLDHCRACAASLDTQTLRMEQTLKTLAAELEKSLVDSKALSQKLVEKTSAYVMLEQELETRHAETKKAFDKLEARYNVSILEVERLTSEQSFIAQKDAQRSHDVRISSAEAANLRAELASLRTSLNKSQDDLKAADTEIAKLSLAEREATEQLAIRTREAREAGRQIGDMHSKLKELESAHLKVLSEVKHMQAREDDALRLCKDLRQEKKEVVLAHDSLKNVLAKKDKESKLLNDEHANSKTELEKLRREFALIKQELEMLKLSHKDAPVGVGLVITERHPHRVLTVVENSAAAACGEIVAGDIIQGIDGTDVEDQDIKVVRGMLMGAAGSRVHVALKRGGHRELGGDEAQQYEVTIVRGFRSGNRKPRLGFY